MVLLTAPSPRLRAAWTPTGVLRSSAGCSLPAGTPQNGFVLHPSLMDGAFQCALGMALNEAGASTEGAALPFALDRVEILGPCVPEMAVHIRISGKGEQTGRVRTLDLDLMDMDGSGPRPHAGLRDAEVGEACSRADEGLGGRSASVRAGLASDHDRSDREPGRNSRDATCFSAIVRKLSANGLRVDGLIGPAAFPKARRPLPTAASPSTRPRCSLSSKTPHASAVPALLQVVIPKDAGLLAGLAGLLRTAQQEVPRLNCQLLALDPVLGASETLPTPRRLCGTP